MTSLTESSRSAAASAALQRVRMLLAGRQAQEGRRVAEQLLAGDVDWAEGQHLLGLARRAAGDAAGAEAALVAAVRADPQAGYHAALAETLAARGEDAGAETAFTRALELDMSHEAAAIGLAELFLRLGRVEAAIEATAAAVASPNASHALLAIHARALKGARRWDEALGIYQRAVRLHPSSGLAEHNVASTLADIGRFSEAEDAALRAQAKGLDAPETWLVLGRSLMNQNSFEAAEAAFAQALRRRPHYLEAHRDSAQLLWMRTGDIGAATVALDRTLASPAVQADLLILKADLLSSAGEVQAAYDLLRRPAQNAPEIVQLSVAAARLAALLGCPEAALAHVEATAGRAPRDPNVALALCEAWLGVGDAKAAAAQAERLLRIKPHDQALIAYLLTCWRLLSDGRYYDWTDYDRLTSVDALETPAGWASLDRYLDDLEATLEARHAFRTHPLGQSVRHGSQISHLNASAEPVIKAFFDAAKGPILRFLAQSSGGADPMSSRNRGRYGFDGAWSVRLPAGGFHRSHIHPEGWISSACYIALPGTGGDEHAGWLQFGEPGIPTRPGLAPDHFIKPERGLLALFPAYLWHGTRPFSSDRHRLTLAFDLTPSPRAPADPQA
ncbi:putative 2OG-Fe(II) oxygenase [Caulobacter sp. S45]|uniref:putative 2OG-Fe(II) oxygenase n=1 Tax=Caulobacter sp. S45 TaxID=1641861 RepID=UPI001575B800|nr:putative 2OG-Fe(II) oxygenase [Caulobacter sp. S45]